MSFMLDGNHGDASKIYYNLLSRIINLIRKDFYVEVAHEVK